MKIKNWKSLSTEEQKDLINELRKVSTNQELRQTTAKILEEVRVGSVETLINFTQRFDGVSPSQICVKTNLAVQENQLSDAQMDAINTAYKNIYAFHKRQKDNLEFQLETSPGVTCQRITRPIQKVGLYVPGGSAPLVSSVLMMGIPARVAGCGEVILCTPPNSDGFLDPAIGYAANLCGIEQVFLLGGAQAIGAMAYGIEPIPAVDKIYGPGNRYVSMAKTLVCEQINNLTIDLPAGPSEVLVIADSSANPKCIAADLLSQAEHDQDARVICILTDQSLVESVKGELARQVNELPRADIASSSLENSYMILAENVSEAVQISNILAPEHLILNIQNPRLLLGEVQSAGSIFLGPWTPESFGDYASGTNHVLPTNGAAQSYSGLGVESFLKTISVQECSKTGFLSLKATVEILAELEGLEAHKKAVSLRYEILEESLQDELANEVSAGENWIQELIPPHVKNLKPYESARFLSEGQSTSIFLDANENPYPALVGTGKSALNRYPEPRNPALINRLSEFYNLDVHRIFPCRGSDEAIDLLMRGFCTAGQDSVAAFQPTFGYYLNCANLNNLKYYTVPLSSVDDFNPDWVQMQELCDQKSIRMVFLCSPNNPTGGSLSRQSVEDFLAYSQQRFLVVLDEAYCEFSTQASLKDLIDQYPNLVILRTFSKGLGLAGLRFGVALGNRQVIDVLRKISPPYPIPANVIETILDFLKPGPLLLATRRIAKIIEERERLRKALTSLKTVVRVFPSDGNFLLVQFKDPVKVMTQSRRFGILLRDRSKEIPGCVRISIGTPEANNLLIELISGEKSSNYDKGENRLGEVSRVTGETSIFVSTDLNPKACSSISTGIPFLDHMLEQVSRHGEFGLNLHCSGDLEVDDHHSVEDCALALGESIRRALKDRRGIGRYGFTTPMDESIARVSLDLSGRPAFVLEGSFGSGRLGNLNLEMVPHFFQSFSQALGCALHIEVRGENSHHKVEAAFKGLGKTLSQAMEIRSDMVPSTKGMLT